MRNSILQDLTIWQFEDENRYLHMDLANKDEDPPYWIKAVQEKVIERDEVFSKFP